MAKRFVTIDSITAFVAKNETGHEGIMGMKVGDQWVPLIGADQVMITRMIRYAEDIKRMSGQDYRIVQFSTRTDITDQVKIEHGISIMKKA